MIKGKRDQLVGKIQEKYGIMRDAAERDVDRFVDEYDRTRPVSALYR